MKILSLSGGGYRGLITLMALEKLEVKYGKLNEYFDLIAGTSAGGIIGACLSAGMRVSQIIDLWQQLGKEVFKPNRLRGYFNAKYRIQDLERVVKYVLDGRLPKGKSRLIVTTFDDVTETAVILKTHDNRYSLSLADFAIATAAAPTYFAPYRVGGFAFVDGGVYSTNPSREALTEALMLGAKPDEIYHISIGTGYNKMNINVNDWGLFQWVLSGRTPIVRIFMESSQDVSVKTASMIGNYKHYDIYIAREHAEMDKPEFTNEYINYGQELANQIE
jgi:patatin-like phospholipase/acyl hydrolase